MGFLSWLTQGKQGPDQVSSTSSTSTTALPGWYTDYTSNLAAKATAATQQGYKPYTGERVAGLTTDEKNAGSFMRDNMTAWRDPLDQATNIAGQAAGGFDPSKLGQFINPHTAGVVDEIGRLGREGFNAIGGTADTMRDEFVGSGGFGSSRHMNALGRAANENERNILGQQTGALQQGFDSAMSNMGQWSDRSMNAAGQLGGLAQMRQGMDLTAAGGLDAIGEKERAINQAGMDVGYQNYLDERGFPLQQLQGASQVMQGQQIPQTVSQTGTQTTPGNYQASPLQSLMGVTMLGAGIKGLFSKDGGRVPRRYRKGGRVGGLRACS